jgi:GrpB-like predicted nucleotidyltransferase (UPF0157 family)
MHVRADGTVGPAMTSKIQRLEEVQAITIGPVARLADGKIVLLPYDPEWPALFEREAARVRGVLGDRVRLLEHVGSTSVPGLSAKPIIDLVLGVPDSSDEPAYVPDMEAAGYVLRIREPDWFEHRLFKGPDTIINLHTFSAGSSETDKMLLFRNWLRTHDVDRDLYQRAKLELAERQWEFTQQYADSKSEVVHEILARAGWHPPADGPASA